MLDSDEALEPITSICDVIVKLENDPLSPTTINPGSPEASAYGLSSTPRSPRLPRANELDDTSQLQTNALSDSVFGIKIYEPGDLTIIPTCIPLSDPEEDDDKPTGTSHKKKYTAEIIRNMWNWCTIFDKLGTQKQCVDFCLDRGLIPKTKMCHYHRSPMSVSYALTTFGIFRCRKDPCRKKMTSCSKGTWFEAVRISPVLVFKLMYAFSEKLTYFSARKECSTPDSCVSSSTVGEWYHYCRETVTIYELANQDYTNKIGGPNKTIFIDVSKFEKCKSKKAECLLGHWVLGMIEGDTEEIRLEMCPDDKTSELIIPLIKKHVQEGSIIQTDDWDGFAGLSEHGYSHRRSNPASSDCKLKRKLPLPKLLKQFYRDYDRRSFNNWLCEYSWRRKIYLECLDPFEELIRAILYVYNDIKESNFTTVMM